MVVVNAIPEPTNIAKTLIVDRTIPTSPFPSFPKTLATINQARNIKPLEITAPSIDHKELTDNSLRSAEEFIFFNAEDNLFNLHQYLFRYFI